MNWEGLFESSLFIAIASLLIGSFLTAFIGKLSSKTKKVSYLIQTSKIATSTNDQIFGNIRVTWKDQEVRNLYLIDIILENKSGKNIENLIFKVYTEDQTRLMNEKAVFEKSTYIINWSDAYNRLLTVPPDSNPTQQQFNFYNTMREYKLDIFKRFSKAFFTFLCTRPNDDKIPVVWVESPTGGITLKQAKIFANNGYAFNVPTHIATLLGIAISICYCTISIIFIKSNVVIGITNAFLGSFASLFGAIFYKAFCWAKKTISV